MISGRIAPSIFGPNASVLLLKYGLAKIQRRNNEHTLWNMPFRDDYRSDVFGKDDGIVSSFGAIEQHRSAVPIRATCHGYEGVRRRLRIVRAQQECLKHQRNDQGEKVDGCYTRVKILRRTRN